MSIHAGDNIHQHIHRHSHLLLSFLQYLCIVLTVHPSLSILNSNVLLFNI